MKSSDSSNYLTAALIVAFFIIGIPIVLYLCNFGNFKLSNDQAIWGQFGDFLNVFVSIANLFVLSILTWGIFVAEQDNDKKKKEKEKEDSEFSKLKYLSFLLEKSLTFSKELKNGLVKSSKEISKNPQFLSQIITNTPNEIEILTRKINQEKYFHSYVNQFKNYDVMNAMSGLDVIYTNFESIIESYQTSQKNDYDRKTEAVRILKQCVDEVREIIRILNPKNKEEEGDLFFLKTMLQVYIDALKKNTQDIFQFEETFLHEILAFFTNNSRNVHPRYLKLLDLVSSCKRSFIPIRENNLAKGKQLMKFSKEIVKIIEQVNPVVDKLSTFLKEKEESRIKQ